jgi:dTDP-4-dehydrorhamnose 3,5-epimerase
MTETILNGAQVLTHPAFTDDRGLFVKTFHDTTLQRSGIHFTLKESYFSISKKDVIRGMHFQLPPHQHAKIVFCPVGAILDVIVDLRKGSPTFGRYATQELSAENHTAFYIPEGFAHGFKALTEGAMTYYLVSSEYSQQYDTGILYNSFGFDWNVATPVLSARDLSFGSIEAFDSPFTFTSAQ